MKRKIMKIEKSNFKPSMMMMTTTMKDADDFPDD
jgi:hypothetical protein